MRWIWMTLGSALLLGIYDVIKKESLKKNGVLEILFLSTLLSAVFLSPFLSAGSLKDHLCMLLKGVLVTSSWISGMLALKMLPITTASTIKASRPVFVLLFSIILFAERLSFLQWAGSITILTSMFLLNYSSKNEGISFSSNKGLIFIWVSVLTGSASALFDKHIMQWMQPLFVQSWANVYIAGLLGLSLLINRAICAKKMESRTFRWDWNILLIALFITAADFLYFFALKDEGAMLSVISMIRRSAVIVPFLFGAFYYKEKQIGRKAIILSILLAGMVLIILGS